MSKNTGTSELINYFDLGVNGDVGISGNLTLSTIVNATVDTDRFLVSDSGVIKYRTGAELLSDIGAAGSFVTLDTAQTITGAKTFNNFSFILAANGTSNQSIFSNSSGSQSSIAGINFFGFNNSNDIYFNKGTSLNAGFFQFNNSAARTYSLPNASGTIALTTDLSGYLPLTGGTLTGTLSVTNNGQVLIGTTTAPTPVTGVSFPLSITSSQATRIRIDSSRGAPNYANAGVGLYASGVQKWSFAHYSTDSGANYDFTIYNDALTSSAILVKGSNSNVLIGSTVDNGARLQVSGTGVAFNFTTSNGLIGNINSSAANGGYVTWQTNGTTIADIGTAQQVFGTGGNDTFGINGRGARALTFGTNNAERLRITSSGNLLVGGTSDNGARLQVSGFGTISNGLQISGGPAGYGGAELVLNSASDGLNAIYTNGGGAVGMFFDHRGTSNSGYWVFRNGTGAASERLRITSSGNVGIGTQSPLALLTVGDGATQQQPYLALSRNSLGGFWAGIRWYDGNTIKSVIQEDGDFNLRFSTSNTERMRITSSGNVLIGTTVDNGSKLQVYGTATFSAGIELSGTITNFGTGTGVYTRSTWYNDTGNQILFENARQTDSASGIGRTVYFTWRGGPSVGGGVQLQHGANAWAAYTSDARLKTKVADIENGIDAIMKLTPIKFKWSRELENSRTVTGFTAQNVGEAIPDAVFNSWKDVELGDVKSYYQDYLTPYLVKAIQELKAELDELKGNN